jgi:hypothetical protein
MPHDLMTTDIPVALAPVDTSRKLHIGHFAFMRALIQGTDTKAAWERYLQIEGEHSDARIVRKTINWIRDAFAAAAKREHKFGTARLVLSDWSKVGQRERQQPTLDQFVVDRGKVCCSVARPDAVPSCRIGRCARQICTGGSSDVRRTLASARRSGVTASGRPASPNTCATAGSWKSRNKWPIMNPHARPASMTGARTKYLSMKSNGS